MKMRLVKGLAILIALCSTLLGTSLVRAQLPKVKDANETSNTELQRDVAALESLRKSGDLDALEEVVDRNSAKWRHRDHKEFVNYMHEACSTLSSYDIGDLSKRALLLDRCAQSVLRSGDLTLEENVQFVEFLELDPPILDQQSWTHLREEKARSWLTGWRRVANSIDPAFDFDDLPYIHVPPPPGSGVPTGVSPEAIKDPKLRAEYERAIAANTAKIQRYNEQYYLKRTAPYFYSLAEQYLVSAYSRAPMDSSRLEALLLEYVNDPVSRKRVLDEVRKTERQP